MIKLTRRELLAGSLATCLASRAKAYQLGVIRKSVATPEGKTDLEKLARAVRLMDGLPASDPRSWTFQWYIHAVPTSVTKRAELERLYPTATPLRRLAESTWSTCAAHRGGSDPDDFLPWHRKYLFYFERTVQSLLNDASFALPYWNYTDPAQRALPPEFLMPDHPLYGTLFRAARRAPVNEGAAIDSDLPEFPAINLDSLSQPTYRATGARSGFCAEIDGELHGTVHVRVGNRMGMGSVPWAANDPIFWVHHANIDRLWASWNNNGGRNPADAQWLERTHRFPDGLGGEAAPSNGEVTSLGPHTYNYDALEPGPTVVAATAGERPVVVIGRSAQPLDVGAGGAETSLQPLPQPPGVVAAAGRRTFLLISRLEAQSAPGVIYEVQIQKRDGSWESVGYINFFDAVAVTHSEDGHAASPPDRRFSFDVTDALDGVGELPPVRVRPVGEPEGASRVRVGLVELVFN